MTPSTVLPSEASGAHQPELGYRLLIAPGGDRNVDPIGGSLRIAAAGPSDLHRLLDLLEGAATWLEGRGIRQWPVGSFRSRADQLATAIARGEVYLSWQGDQVVGTLRLTDEDRPVWPDGADAWYVHSFAVDRQWAGRGVGAQLLAWVAAQARATGKDRVRLDCLASNTRLVAYYTAAGFTPVGIVEVRYSHTGAPTDRAFALQRFEQRLPAGTA